MTPIQAFGLAARTWLETNIGTWAPWVLLPLVLWLIDKFFDAVGITSWIEKHTPNGKLITDGFNKAPTVALGAAWPYLTSGDGDPLDAVYGALAGLVATIALPFLGKVAKKNGGPPTSGLVLLVALGLVGCTGNFLRDVANAAKTANEAAAMILCGDVFSEQYGITPEEARQFYCKANEVLEPFLLAVEDAKASAAPMALKAAKQAE